MLGDPPLHPTGFSPATAPVHHGETRFATQIAAAFIAGVG